MGGRRTLPRGLCRVVWKQAAGIVARLLRADGARRGGASIKTLTLAPGIAAKKATHAIVCETLKHIPLLKLVLEDAGVPLTDDVFADGRKRAAAAADDDEAETEDDHADDASEDADADADPDDATAAASRVLHRSTAYVLGYEVLFGAGVDPEPDGRALPPDESAVVAASPALRKALRRRLKSAGVSTADAFLLAQRAARSPRYPSTRATPASTRSRSRRRRRRARSRDSDPRSIPTSPICSSFLPGRTFTTIRWCATDGSSFRAKLRAFPPRRWRPSPDGKFWIVARLPGIRRRTSPRWWASRGKFARSTRMCVD